MAEPQIERIFASLILRDLTRDLALDWGRPARLERTLSANPDPYRETLPERIALEVEPTGPDRRGRGGFALRVTSDRPGSVLGDLPWRTDRRRGGRPSPRPDRPRRPRHHPRPRPRPLPAGLRAAGGRADPRPIPSMTLPDDAALGTMAFGPRVPDPRTLARFASGDGSARAWMHAAPIRLLYLTAEFDRASSLPDGHRGDSPLAAVRVVAPQDSHRPLLRGFIGLGHGWMAKAPYEGTIQPDRLGDREELRRRLSSFDDPRLELQLLPQSAGDLAGLGTPALLMAVGEAAASLPATSPEGASRRALEGTRLRLTRELVARFAAEPTLAGWFRDPYRPPLPPAIGEARPLLARLIRALGGRGESMAIGEHELAGLDPAATAAAAEVIASEPTLAGPLLAACLRRMAMAADLDRPASRSYRG